MEPAPGEQPDPAAFELIVEEYADRIYNVALRITHSPQDAEDVMQDACLAAFRNWSTFRGEAARTTWLYRIAVNAALARVRRRHEDLPLEHTGYEATRIANWSPDLGRQLENDELRAALVSALGRLPTDLRVVVVLRDVDGLSSAEVAAVLDLSDAAVKSRLHRARVLLRQHLADYVRTS